MTKKLLTNSFLLALGEGVYIFLVAMIMRNAERIFGNVPEILGIITFLMLFVISATISGTLVLGKPALLFLESKKAEAFRLFGMILGWLLVFLMILLIAMTI